MVLYQSLSQSERTRSDVKVDVKYDIFKDFFIQVGTAMNYDSQPTAGATNFDYVIQSTLGWKFW